MKVMSTMSFREKSAWISLVSIALVFGVYFARILGLLPAAWMRGNPFQLFLLLVASLVVLEVVLHLAIAMQSPRDARTPKDERERLIDMKATRAAFPVLLVGTFAAIGTLHLPMNRLDMAHVMLVSIVVAELTRFGAQVVYHRRGF
jgi:hypothetical protein